MQVIVNCKQIKYLFFNYLLNFRLILYYFKNIFFIYILFLPLKILYLINKLLFLS